MAYDLPMERCHGKEYLHGIVTDDIKVGKLSR
jgi:hypothetical protein